jgi:branched-chain amino acid:cation transporter, LIVCS family
MKKSAIKDTPKTNILITSFAIFSMFFGAGNVVFPLALGQTAQSNNFYAILGLLITAVGVPFIGLISMTLFNGNYNIFFDRIGKVPGKIITGAILLIIGPLAATPRCITVAHSTMSLYFPSVNLITFSLISCLIIYSFTIKKGRILDILGYVLTPFLLGSVVTIIVRGLWTASSLPISTEATTDIFFNGLIEGYQTMDLFGGFFFSAVVLSCLEQNVSTHDSDRHNFKKMILLTLKSGCIGMSMLAIIYVGFSYVAAFYSASLVDVPKSEMIAAVALHVLGPYAGIIVGTAVTLACLTTAIALVIVFSRYLKETLFHDKISHRLSLLLTLACTFGISTLNFSGIARIASPFLEICYPALIVLSILNITNKLYHVRIVKTPVFITFAIALVVYIVQNLL